MPPAPIRYLRDLTRYRKSLIQERTREANRVHKLLEDAGIKLATWPLTFLGPRHAGRAGGRHDGPMPNRSEDLRKLSRDRNRPASALSERRARRNSEFKTSRVCSG